MFISAAVILEANVGAASNADVDCMVTEWSSYSECTVSCGTGLRSRKRMIKVPSSGNGTPCPKDLYDSAVRILLFCSNLYAGIFFFCFYWLAVKWLVLTLCDQRVIRIPFLVLNNRIFCPGVRQ